MSAPLIFYTTIVFIILIYLSGIFAITQFIKFIQCTILNSKHPFFQHRHSTINILYISCFVFTLYIINPLTFILININIDQTIPLFINDITHNLLFLLFFTRIWVFGFDSYFIAMLKNWMWRREINSRESETNIVIKYRNILSANRRTIATIMYSVIVSPIYIILLILSDSNIIHHLIYRTIYTLMSIILLCITYYLIKNKISIVTDQYYIRIELLQCIKTAGLLYILSQTFYFILYPIHSEIAKLVEILLLSSANFSIIYISCYLMRKYFIFDAISSLNGTKKSKLQKFVKIFSEKHRITFEDIMGHRYGVEAFCRHLANEFGLESILFIIEFCQYKSKINHLYPQFTHNIPWPAHSESKIFTLQTHSNILNAYWLPMDHRIINYSPYQIALYLYDKYIEQSADLCLNISSTNRREMYRKFKSLAQELSCGIDGVSNMKESEEDIVITLYELFDSAYKEIWHLIQNDTFIRFRSTDPFEKLIHILYPKQAKQALHEAENINTEISNTQTTVKSIAIQTTHDPVHELHQVITMSVLEHVHDDEYSDEKEDDLPEIIHAASNPIKKKQNGILQLQMSAKTDRHSCNPYIMFNNKSEESINNKSDPSIEFIETIMIPSDMLNTAATFWRKYVTTLPSQDTLEIGISIYLSMFATDKTMRNYFGKHRLTTQKQIESISLKFLNMISWLIQSLWSRDNNELNFNLTKLGILHDKLKIKNNHFNIMLQSFNETFKHYFPIKYRKQEEYCFDYIFAYASQIMTKEPLSNKTKYKTYYKTLELKFNSEKKLNQSQTNNIPKNAKKLKLNYYSMPLPKKAKKNDENKETSSSCFTLNYNYSKINNKNIRRASSTSALIIKSNVKSHLTLNDATSLSIKLME